MKKLINLRLPLFIAFSLALGIAISYFSFMQNLVCVIVFSCLLGISLLTYLIFSFKVIVKALVFSVIFLLFFVLGYMLFNVNLNAYNQANLGNHYHDVKGKIIEVYQTNDGKKIILSDIEVNIYGELDYNATLYVNGEIDLDIGDIVEFNGRLMDNSARYEDRFLANSIADKIKYTITINSDQINVCANDTTMFEDVNLFIRESLKSGMDGDEFSVAYALLTGNSNFMSEDVIGVFRNTGVAHIFAVSGLHIGFLATALNLLLKKLRINKYAKATLITLALFFYSGICGFSASSIRASIMCAIMLFLTAKGERYDGLSAVAISAIIILIISPMQLFCVGFQLSFTVVIGILTLSPLITRLLKFTGKRVSSSLGTVISAQISGLPICLYAFNQVSPISIIANFVFIPVVGIVFVLLLLGAVLGGAFGISFILLFPTKYLITALIFLIRFFDNNFLLIGGFSLGVFAVIYYLLMFTVSDIINLKRLTKLIVSLVLCASLIACTIVKTNAENQSRIYISGSEDLCATMIVSESENVLIISQLDYWFSTYRLNRIVSKENIEQVDLVILQNFGENIDFPRIATRLNALFKVKEYVYYGEKNASYELVLTSSFRGVKVSNSFDGDINYQSEIFKFTYQGNGTCLTFSKSGGQKYSILTGFDRLGIIPNNLRLNGGVIVATDSLEVVNSRFSPSEFISYMRSNAFRDAQTEGNIKYYLK